MKQKLASQYAKLNKYSLEHKIFIICCIVGITFSFFTAIMNLVLNIGLIATLASFLMGVFSSGLLYLSFKNKKFSIYALIILVVLTFILYPAVWILSGGSEGTIPYFFIMNMLFIPLVLKRKLAAIMFTANVIILSALIILEVSFDTLVIPYANDTQRIIDIGFVLVLLCIGAYFIGYILIHTYNEKINKLDSMTKALEKLSITDELTGLYNRRFIKDTLTSIVAKKELFSVIMVDIDDFKIINDTYGHSVGDTVIVKISQTLKNLLKSNHIIGRIGGEEFLIIIKEEYNEKLFHYAEYLRLTIEEINYPEIGRPVTISLGTYNSKANDSIDKILVEVDKCLYAAKNAGKNKVILKK